MSFWAGDLVFHGGKNPFCLMEWNSKKAGVSLQEIETDKDMDTESLCNTFVSAGSLLLSNKLDKNCIGMEKMSGRSSESFITSELGKQKSASSIPASNTATKRSRASYQKMQNPSCQVEGCYLDLSLAKDYHRRHRICEIHSKSPRVIVAGMERRFCQQCSRFHGLSEFDDNKRSCRRRLSDHNARRRRMQQPESIHFSSAGLSSSLYERTSQNVLLNVSLSNRTGENICNSTLTQASDSLVRPSKTGGNYRRSSLYLPNDEIPSAAYNLHHVEPERLFSLESRNPRVLDQYVPSASSLLSIDNHHWSLNRDESTSVEGLMHRDNPNWSSNHVQVAADEGPAVSPTNLHHSGSTLLQEFDLFKTPYHSACFHSNDQRNL